MTDLSSPEPSAHDLMLRRTELIEQIRTYPGGVDQAPLEWLEEHARICSKLRMRNAGPPRSKPKKASDPKGSKRVDDLLGL